MCVIAYGRKSDFPKKELLQCMKANPSGFFLAAIRPDGEGPGGKIVGMVRTLSRADAEAAFDKAENGDMILLHARIPSRGDTTLENVHGWPGDGGEVFFAHNGTMHSLPKEEGKTDSQSFFEHIFLPLWRGAGKEFSADVEYAIRERTDGYNKFAFLLKTGEVKLYGEYVEDHGMKYSNNSYKVYEPAAKDHGWSQWDCYCGCSGHPARRPSEGVAETTDDAAGIRGTHAAKPLPPPKAAPKWDAIDRVQWIRDVAVARYGDDFGDGSAFAAATLGFRRLARMAPLHLAVLRTMSDTSAFTDPVTCQPYAVARRFGETPMGATLEALQMRLSATGDESAADLFAELAAHMEDSLPAKDSGLGEGFVAIRFAEKYAGLLWDLVSGGVAAGDDIVTALLAMDSDVRSLGALAGITRVPDKGGVESVVRYRTKWRATRPPVLVQCRPDEIFAPVGCKPAARKSWMKLAGRVLGALHDYAETFDDAVESLRKGGMEW